MMPEGEPAGPSEHGAESICSLHRASECNTAVGRERKVPKAQLARLRAPSGIIGAPSKERFTKLVNDLHVLYCRTYFFRVSVS